MSTVKSNKFSPQSQPIVQIDGFNDVESFVVGTNQLNFTTTKFDQYTPVRAFKRNDIDPVIWDELTVNFFNDTQFTIQEAYSEGDEILLYGNVGLASLQVVSDNVVNQSTNTEFDYQTLTEVIDWLGASAKLESYKTYGLGTTTPQQLDLTTSTGLNTGIYVLSDVGYNGVLISVQQGGAEKQVYLPFDSDIVYTRDTQRGDEFIPATSTEVVEHTTGFTLSYATINRYNRVNSGTAVDVTIPDSATLNFDIGTTIDVVQTGTGSVTFVAPSGVTINTPSTTSITGSFGKATLTKVGTDEWDLTGNV